MTPVHIVNETSEVFRSHKCRVIIGHSGGRRTSGHWIAFVFRDQTQNWWKIDSIRRQAIQENPFQNQSGVGRGQYTLNLFMFGITNH